VQVPLNEPARPAGRSRAVSASAASWAARVIATAVGKTIMAQESITPGRSFEQVDSEFLDAGARLQCAQSADCTKVRALYPAA
jgi:hypothetical protein